MAKYHSRPLHDKGVRNIQFSLRVIKGTNDKGLGQVRRLIGGTFHPFLASNGQHCNILVSLSSTGVLRLPTRRRLRKDIVRDHRISDRSRNISQNFQAVSTGRSQPLILEREKTKRVMHRHIPQEHGHINSNVLRTKFLIIRGTGCNGKGLYNFNGQFQGQTRRPTYRSTR